MSRAFLRSSRVRVLVNGIHAKSGGGVTYLKNILPLLARDDALELHLFIHRDQFDRFGVTDERVRTHVLDYNNGFFSSLVWEQVALPILARVMSADVTLSPANYGPLLAPRRIIILRNSLAVVGKETRLVRRFYWVGLALMTALSLLTCTKAIAVSDYARQALTFGFRRWRDKISVIHHGVNTAYSPGAFEDREDFLLAVSDIYIQKNLHTLIQAVARIRSQRPGVRLKIIGRAIDDGYMQELAHRIAELGVDDAIEFLGERPTDELLAHYRRCRMFVFPSTVETFGNPLVEAMACGAPMAVSNTAAMPEIVGDAAVWFSPLDPDDMADKILSVLGDDARLRELSELALARSKRFSWEETAAKTAAVIKDVARGGARRIPSLEPQVAP